MAIALGGAMAASRRAIEAPYLLACAAAITALAYFVVRASPAKPARPKWVPEAPDGSVPRFDSRRWARACFFNGIITIEELNAFYASHPEDLTDPDR